MIPLRKTPRGGSEGRQETGARPGGFARRDVPGHAAPWSAAPYRPGPAFVCDGVQQQMWANRTSAAGIGEMDTPPDRPDDSEIGAGVKPKESAADPVGIASKTGGVIGGMPTSSWAWHAGHGSRRERQPAGRGEGYFLAAPKRRATSSQFTVFHHAAM
jgi:hypothetical protein